MKTANPQQGETAIVIAGATYVVAMTFNSMIRLQQLYAVNGERPPVETIYRKAHDGDLEAYRAIFWASLCRHHPEVTLEDAGGLIDAAGGIPALDEILDDAWRQSHPDPRDEAALGPPQKTAARKTKRRGRTFARLT